MATPLFKCNSCGGIIDLDEVDEYLLNECIDDLTEECEEHKYSAWDVLIFDPFGGTRFIYPTGKSGWYTNDSMADALIDHIYQCPHCQVDLELRVWCWFEASFDRHQPWNGYYVEGVDDGFTIDVRNATMQNHYGIYYGKIIRSFIKYFIYRWVALDYRFVIAMPFIDGDGWTKLLQEMFELHCSSFTGKINVDLFLTRKITWGTYSGIGGLEKMRKRYCTKCEKEYGYYEPPCFEGYCFWDKSRYDKIPLIGEAQATKKNFHAKLVAGISPDGMVECIQTSYNFIFSQYVQLETFDLRLIGEDEFNQKFLDPLKSLI